MSSPFRIFRKHQKVLLVIAGLMAMIAFVILPIVLQNFSTQQRATDPVVVTTTKYGNLTRGDIANLRYRHECIVGILSGVAGRLFGVPEEAIRPSLEKLLGSSTDDALVSRWLINKKATEIGIQVSDESITDFLTNKDDAFVSFFMRDPEFAQYLPYLLRNKSLGKLTTEDFNAVFARYSGLTHPMFYDMLREELKSQEFQNTFSMSIIGTPPGQRWEYYCRTRQQAEVECIPVKVDQFAAAIPAPKESELKEYFEKYKNRTPNPYSPEPGFRVPQKSELEFFVANIEDYAAPEKVTDEEIQTYYEKNREYYDDLNKKYLREEAEKAAEKKEPAANEGEKTETPAPGKPADAEKPAESATPAETATPSTPAEPEKKDAEKKDTENKDAEKPQGEPTPPPATDKPADQPQDKPADQPKEKPTDQPQEKPADKPEDKPADQPQDKPEEKSSAVEHSSFRFVSLAADDNPEQPKPEVPATEAPKADAPKTDVPATEAPKADVPATEAPKADAPVAGGETAAPKTETPAPVTPATETKPADAKPADSKPNEAATPAAAGDTEQAAPPRRQLTEEVKKVIRQRIAGDKILEKFGKIESQMKDNAIGLKRYDAAKLHGDTDVKPPVKLDFESLAKQHGVTAGKTGEITVWEARETEIGKSGVENSGRAVFAAAFDINSRRSEISKYTPYKSGTENSIYLFWKTKESKEAVPNWDDAAVKKQVLEAWQLEQARKPALEQAKKLAEEATKSKATLKEAFAANKDLEVISPPPFTWLKGGLDPRNPQYDLNIDVKGIDIPGEDFMKEVFSLKPQGVGTVMNEPKTIAYVVQVEKFDPAEDVLWKRFMDEDYNRYADAAQGDRQAAWMALMTHLTKESGMKWEPKAEGAEKEDTAKN